MTIILHAQPYDISATGFYFESAEDYETKATCAMNDCGQPVEEFEVQFIDGEETDNALANAWGLHQSNFAAFLEASEDWDDDRKRRYIIAVGECGFSHDQAADDPNGAEIDNYEVESLRDLAEMFVDDGLYGEIPESLQLYIDHDAIARDLAVDFSEITIAGGRYVYACR